MDCAGLALLGVTVSQSGRSVKRRGHQYWKVLQSVMSLPPIHNLPTFLCTPAGINGGILEQSDDFGHSQLTPHLHHPQRKATGV